MTGAPIYLVSACTSGEEFVAAFRRYADRNGLFIPIGEPLPPGRRARFAVTLRDGGVMIEGEAEIVSSARAPSVLHGRVGMTLRFLEPDEASKTTLGELERARLAMKPAPPSVPPRPAEIPAAPRPVSPPIQGRIDAVNALAECVAIGDTAALGPALPAVSAAPPKTAPRSAVPAESASGRSGPGTSPPGGGMTPRAATAPRAPAALPPMPIAIAKPGDRATPVSHGTAVPVVTPRATPKPDRLRNTERPAEPAPAAPAISGLSRTMTAVAPVEPGPTSDTMVAVTPPAPSPPSSSPTAPRHAAEMAAVPRPTTQPEGSPISTTMTAVPAPGAIPASAPTDIGGVLVEPLPPLDPMGQSSPEIAVPITSDDGASGRTQIHLPEEASERTQIHAGAPRPPAPPAAPAAPELPNRRTSGSVTVLGMPPVLRAPAPPGPEIEIAEPTDISMPPEAPRSLSTETMAAVEPDAAAPSEELPAEPDSELLDEPPSESSPQRPRRTVIGVAVVPSGVMVLPATPTVRVERDASTAAADEATGPDRVVVGDGAIDGSAPTLPPTPPLAATLDETAPWMPAPDTAPPAGRPPAPAMPPNAGGGLPSGDWTIARDPDAPDGWTDPFEAASQPPPGAASAPPAASVAPVPPAPIAANAHPVDAPPVRPSPRLNEVPIVDSKVEVDPVLANPRRGAPPTDEPRAAAAASPGIAGYEAAAPRAAVEAPADPIVMAVPRPPPLASPPAPRAMHPGQVPRYPLDPSYQVPAAFPPPPSPQRVTPSGFGDLRYASDPALQARIRRRNLIIMLASAVVAALIGIAAVLVFNARHPPAAPPGQDRRPGTSDRRTDPAAPRPTPLTAPATDTPAPPAVPAGQTDRMAPPGSGEAAAAPPSPPECFADVSSQPPGADIVLDQTRVIGRTPGRVALPCGGPIELVIRKPRLAPVTRTITPTPEGVALDVTLARQASTISRQTSTVKVTSTPEGATITLNGKLLGITPTTVKVPASEPSALNIAKDGYEPQTERVAPRANGTTIRAVLKKLERKRPRI